MIEKWSTQIKMIIKLKRPLLWVYLIHCCLYVSLLVIFTVCFVSWTGGPPNAAYLLLALSQLWNANQLLKNFPLTLFCCLCLLEKEVRERHRCLFTNRCLSTNWCSYHPPNLPLILSPITLSQNGYGATLRLSTAIRNTSAGVWGVDATFALWASGLDIKNLILVAVEQCD